MISKLASLLSLENQKIAQLDEVEFELVFVTAE
jgi:hypothetical protein